MPLQILWWFLSDFWIEIAIIIVNFTPCKNRFHQSVQRLQFAIKEMTPRYATFRNIFTVHVQKWQFMRFRSNIWPCHSLRRPRFPIRRVYFHCRMTLAGGDWKHETWHSETIKIVEADIARLDNSAPYRKGGHRETCFIVRVEAQYKLIFATGSIIWVVHLLYVCSFT